MTAIRFPHMPQAGTVFDGKYRILDTAGRGGMGIVFLAEALSTAPGVDAGTRVALKVLHATLAGNPDSSRRFLRETQTLVRLSGPHIVRILDAGIALEFDGLPYLVMEYLDGTDLAGLIAREGPQCIRRVLTWSEQIADGLGRAHELGVVHRDLKPANLYLIELDRDPPPLKILDFGIAKSLDDGSMTHTQATLGTARYMAPEQARGKKMPITQAADQWSLGLILYETLGGTSYFEGESSVDLLAQVLFADIRPPSQTGLDLGPAFDAWFLQSCSRNPSDRFPSVKAQVETLRQSLTHLDGGYRLTSRVDRLSAELVGPGSLLRPERAESGPRAVVGPADRDTMDAAFDDDTVPASVARPNLTPNTLPPAPPPRAGGGAKGRLLRLTAVVAAAGLTIGVGGYALRQKPTTPEFVPTATTDTRTPVTNDSAAAGPTPPVSLPTAGQTATAPSVAAVASVPRGMVVGSRAYAEGGAPLSPSGKTRWPPAGTVLSDQRPGARAASLRGMVANNLYTGDAVRAAVAPVLGALSGCYGALAWTVTSEHSSDFSLAVSADGKVQGASAAGGYRLAALDACMVPKLAKVSFAGPTATGKAGTIVLSFGKAGIVVAREPDGDWRTN